MKKKAALAVIGSGYGDEGKGLMVDRLASNNDSVVVVRSNGGAQAGHTVVRPDGRRHVFHHFGSGALTGARTHLSRFFVVNPMLYRGEREALVRLGACVATSVSPQALVTTPFDMMINQIVERHRGDSRHGSCGLGFGETIERKARGFGLTVQDLIHYRSGNTSLRQFLLTLHALWFERRLRELGVSGIVPPWPAPYPAIIDRYVEDAYAFLDTVTVTTTIADPLETVIFEGAQGLMLDQDYGAFPHVTRSHTGIRNMAALAEEAGIPRINAVYVTRAYSTRHGRGPLSIEQQGGPLGFGVVDDTNVPNEWQQSMRFAMLNADVMASAIRADLKHAGLIEVSPALAVTCLDQAAGPFPIFADQGVSFVDPSDAASRLARHLGMSRYHESWGPTRDTVHDGVIGAVGRAA